MQLNRFKIKHPAIIGAFCCLLLALAIYFETTARPLPRSVKRVVFIGNSITYAGKYITDIETVFKTRYPRQKIEFINVGLPSETVSGLSEEGHAGGRFPRPDVHDRLQRILAQTTPDLVFVNYGMNDGIYLPLDSARFDRFKTGMIWLHNEVTATGARIVHVTPPMYDETKGGARGYAAVLDVYAEWLLGQRTLAQWEVADVHFPMKLYLEQQRNTAPGFSLANDGVHPGDLGHWIMAKQILTYLGEPGLDELNSIDQYVAKVKNGSSIYALITEKQNLLKNAWLSAIGHTRPEMPVAIPLQEALNKATLLDKKIKLLQ